ncbi:MAG: RNA polymerase subunit sigma-70 [Oscillospiraceae bacterium]|nr:RNA polymerase subunit sigma-70 [Oscillospiraceae bacterium]
MTQQQKSTIARLRGQGMSYGEIGRRTKLEPNAVKGFCYRQHITVLAQAAEPGVPIVAPAVPGLCKHCGAPLQQREKCKPRKFCCDACRRAWWNAHPEASQRPAASKFVNCAYCGKEIRGANRRYCTHEHYIFQRFPDRRAS